MDRAASQILVEKDGSVLVSVGNTEMGQGAITVLSQICAETLNAPYESVRLTEADTSRVPDSGPTVASRTTLMSGNAIIDGCRPLKERIWSVAAELLSSKGAPSGQMDACGGSFSSGGFSVSFAEAVKECWKRKSKMCEQGWYSAPPTSFGDKDGQGDAYVIYSFSADAVEVEVDSETGEAKVKKITAAHDLGKAVNPALAEGQIEGGALQGIGYALYENLVFKNGVMVNPNFTDYVMPSTREAPEFEPVIIESGYKLGPYAAKGFGETPLIGVAPAVANAISHAVGARLRSLPLLPEKIWSAMNDKA